MQALEETSVAIQADSSGNPVVMSLADPMDPDDSMAPMNVAQWRAILDDVGFPPRAIVPVRPVQAERFPDEVDELAVTQSQMEQLRQQHAALVEAARDIDKHIGGTELARMPVDCAKRIVMLKRRIQDMDAKTLPQRDTSPDGSVTP